MKHILEITFLVLPLWHPLSGCSGVTGVLSRSVSLGGVRSCFLDSSYPMYWQRLHRGHSIAKWENARGRSHPGVKGGSANKHTNPANTRRWTDVVFMLGQRRRRWSNMKTTSGQCSHYKKWSAREIGFLNVTSKQTRKIKTTLAQHYPNTVDITEKCWPNHKITCWLLTN